MTKHNLVLFSVLCLTVLLAACGTNNTVNIQTIDGSGTIVTGERDVSGFSSIQINLGADLSLTSSDSESLSIEADDNLMDYIKAEVRNGMLVISTPDNTSLKPSQPIQLHVSFKELTTIEVNGSSAITGDDLNLDVLTVSFSGSGSTRLAGTVNNQTITIRGQATINNFDLSSQHVTIDISGSGILEVSAADTLNVTVAGMGTIRYKGDPTITRNISGTATILQSQ